MTANRHIVDQLADIRAQIRDLQNREKVLKTAVSKKMGDSDTLGGDEYVAVQRMQKRKGAIDADALTSAGIDPDKFRKAPITAYILHVEPRVAEVA